MRHFVYSKEHSFVSSFNLGLWHAIQVLIFAHNFSILFYQPIRLISSFMSFMVGDRVSAFGIRLSSVFRRNYFLIIDHKFM